MTIVDWFDPTKREHLEAWAYLMQTGAWPEDFIACIPDLERTPAWHIQIAIKITAHYVESTLRGHWQKEVPKATGQYWLATRDGLVTGPDVVAWHVGDLVMAGGLRVQDGIGAWRGWYWSEPLQAPPKPGPWEDDYA